MMYGSWDMEPNREFFVIWDRFLAFYTPMDPKIELLEEGVRNFLLERGINLKKGGLT